MLIASTLPDTPTERYLALLDRYALYASSAGKQIRRSTAAEGRRLFEKTSPERRAALLARLEVETRIFAEASEAGERLTDSRHLLWRHFRRSGLTPASDLFDKIGETDVVEVYGLDNIHLFQNLNFFDWIGFTLEQIYSETWYALTRRDPKIEKALHAFGARLVSGEIRGTVDPEIPWHLLEEIGTETLYKFYIRIKHVSPVFSGGALACFVAVNECKPYEGTSE